MPSPAMDTPQPHSGIILVVVVVLLAVVAGMGLHLLTEARIRLDAAQHAWETARLDIAAESAARRALQACADLFEQAPDRSPSDPDRPHIFWEDAGTDPAGIRVHARLLDAQRRFDFHTLAPLDPDGNPAPEAVRIATELFRRLGDPTPAARVEVLSGMMAPALGETDPTALEWNDLIRHPDFGIDYLENPARGRTGIPARGPVSRLFTLIPHGFEEHPLPINVNTAGREVLHALWGSAHEAPLDRLLARRREQPFRTPEEAAAVSGLAADQAAALEPWVTVRSTWFEIESEASVDGRKRTIRALAHRNDDGAVAVVRWIPGP